MTEQTYSITAYRDSRGRTWNIDKRGRWYSGGPATIGVGDDHIDGFADARYETLAELSAARGSLVPLDVDNVEALLADLATVRKHLVEPGGKWETQYGNGRWDCWSNAGEGYEPDTHTRRVFYGPTTPIPDTKPVEHGQSPPAGKEINS